MCPGCAPVQQEQLQLLQQQAASLVAGCQLAVLRSAWLLAGRR